MKTNHRLSENVLKYRKAAKRRENIQLAIVIALIAIIGNLGVFLAFNLMDSAYEQRAKAAGYKLPATEIRK